MTDDISQILFGKTAKVKLADFPTTGKTYTMRELNLSDLQELGLLKPDPNLDKVDFIELIFRTFRQDDPSLTKEAIGKLVTSTVLADVMAGLGELGIGASAQAEKNGQAGSR